MSDNDSSFQDFPSERKYIRKKPYCEINLSELSKPGKYRIVGTVTNVTNDTFIINDGSDQIEAIFTVPQNLEVKEGTDYSFKNVKDYQIIFNIDTYNLEFDPSSEYSVNDSLVYDYESFYKADDLQGIVGKYLRVTDTSLEDNYTGKKYKSLTFFNE